MAFSVERHYLIRKLTPRQLGVSLPNELIPNWEGVTVSVDVGSDCIVLRSGGSLHG